MCSSCLLCAMFSPSSVVHNLQLHITKMFFVLVPRLHTSGNIKKYNISLFDDHHLFLVWYFCSVYRVSEFPDVLGQICVYGIGLPRTTILCGLQDLRQSCWLPFAIVSERRRQVKFKCPVNFKKEGNLYPSYSLVSAAIIKASNAICNLSGTSSKIIWCCGS